MKIYRTQYAAAAAAIALLAGPSAALAGDLYDAYTLPAAAVEEGVAGYSGDLSSPTASAVLPRQAVGLAAGGDSLYVTSFGGPTNYIERYDLSGAQLGVNAVGPFVAPGALAYGDGMLFGAFAVDFLGGTTYEVSSLSVADVSFDGAFSITLPSQVTGLAYGDGAVFVAYDSTLARYDLTGQLLGSYDYGTVLFNALTYGAGQLFAGYISGPNFGFASVDPLTFGAGGANVSTDSLVKGLAFGDGGVFASFDHSLAKYDLDGGLIATLDTGRQINGALAFAPDAGVVPEPQAWALMILGFGAMGGMLRRRRLVTSA
jgi:hypothetical protein